MTDDPLHVAVIWHMHQLFCRDPLSGVYRHYLNMVEILRDFPLIRQNFNLLPSLLEQLNDCCEKGASDILMRAGTCRKSI